MSLLTILLILLVLAAIGALPNWSYATTWGYGPSGALGFLVILLVILVLTRGV